MACAFLFKHFLEDAVFFVHFTADSLHFCLHFKVFFQFQIAVHDLETQQPPAIARGYKSGSLHQASLPSGRVTAAKTGGPFCSIGIFAPRWFFFELRRAGLPAEALAEAWPGLLCSKQSKTDINHFKTLTPIIHEFLLTKE
jgi:hypothetical protein